MRSATATIIVTAALLLGACERAPVQSDVLDVQQVEVPFAAHAGGSGVVLDVMTARGDVERRHRGSPVV